MSLFEELTTLPQPQYPVIKLLINLLTLVAQDACATRRNVHSMCLAVSRARDVCQRINTLAGTAGDGDSWDNFRTYARMIPLLEDILLDFESIAHRESKAGRLPTTNSVEEDLEFIDAWKSNRAQLRQIVTRLQEAFQDDAPTDAEIKATYKHDDSALLTAVSESLVDLTKTLSGNAQGNILEIQKKLHTVQDALIIAPSNLPDDVVVYAAQAAMAIEIVARARNDQMLLRRKSQETWMKAVSVMDLLEKHSGKANLPIDPLRKAWDDFRAYLLVKDVPPGVEPVVSGDKLNPEPTPPDIQLDRSAENQTTVPATPAPAAPLTLSTDKSTVSEDTPAKAEPAAPADSPPKAPESTEPTAPAKAKSPVSPSTPSKAPTTATPPGAESQPKSPVKDGSPEAQTDTKPKEPSSAEPSAPSDSPSTMPLPASAESPPRTQPKSLASAGRMPPPTPKPGSKPSTAGPAKPTPKSSKPANITKPSAQKPEPTVSLPEEYFALRALVSKILRPYYDQSLVLIDGCIDLATVFNGKQTAEMLISLQSALRDTTAALKAAAEITYEPGAAFVSKEVSTTFDTARESIRKCFKDYKSDSAAFEASLRGAAERDVARVIRLQQLQDRFTSVKKLDNVPPVELSVTITGSGSPTIRTYTFEPTTTLSTVLWKAAKERSGEQADKLRTKGYFEAGGKTLSMGTEVGKLLGEEGKPSVSLIIPN